MPPATTTWPPSRWALFRYHFVMVLTVGLVIELIVADSLKIVKIKKLQHKCQHNTFYAIRVPVSVILEQEISKISRKIAIKMYLNIQAST